MCKSPSLPAHLFDVINTHCYSNIQNIFFLFHSYITSLQLQKYKAIRESTLYQVYNGFIQYKDCVFGMEQYIIEKTRVAFENFAFSSLGPVTFSYCFPNTLTMLPPLALEQQA